MQEAVPNQTEKPKQAPPRRGRKPGARNRASIALENLRKGIADKMKFPDGFSFLTWVMNNDKIAMELRVRAAQKLYDFERPRLLAVASVKKTQHAIDPVTLQKLMQNPSVAAAFETATFALDSVRSQPAGYLPAPEPGTGVTDCEFTDAPNIHESEPGERLTS